MKTKFLALFILFFTLAFTNAQTLVKPEQLTTKYLSEVLKKEGYKILEVQDTFLNISNKEGSLLYMDFDENIEGKRYILMNVNISLKANPNAEKTSNLINEMNRLGMIKVNENTEQNSLGFRYYFWMTNGFVKETFIDAVKEFFLYQGDAYALDTENLIDYAK